MIRSRLRIRTLGACALVFSLAALWISDAQAENTGGSWTYLNAASQLKTFEGLLAEPKIDGEIDTTVVLHSEVFDSTMEVLYECKDLGAIEGALKSNGVTLGKVFFRNCVTFLNGALSTACKPQLGVIITNLIKAQMLLHKLANGTKDKILIAEGENSSGGSISTLASIESTPACALGIKVPVGGRFAIEPSNPTTHEVKHLLKEFSPLTHLWILSDTAEHKANLLGSGWAFLSENHIGLQWAGLWN